MRLGVCAELNRRVNGAAHPELTRLADLEFEERQHQLVQRAEEFAADGPAPNLRDHDTTPQSHESDVVSR